MQQDAIWSRARADLLIKTEQGPYDLFLWEHSVRVAQNARSIAQLAEVRSTSPDEAAVFAAALYHEAGWIVRFRDGEIPREEILIRSMSFPHREQGALMLERSLAKLLPADSLAHASQAIRTLDDRNMESIEGKIVADADNLDEFGVLSLWTTIRRGTVEGKGIQAVIDTWHRRREYRCWDARLKDSFRFAPVRAAAKRRLANFERLMRELEDEHQGADLAYHSESGRPVPSRNPVAN